MASQVQASTNSTTSPKRVQKRATNGRNRRTVRRTTRASTPRKSVGELEQVIRSLEERVAQLTDPRQIRSTVSGATGQVSRAVTSTSDHIGDLVADTLSDVAERLRGGATSVTGAARVGTHAIRRIGGELERRPLMTIAIALGIGFIAGMAGRRDQAS